MFVAMWLSSASSICLSIYLSIYSGSGSANTSASAVASASDLDDKHLFAEPDHRNARRHNNSVVFGFILLLLLPWYTRDVAAEITRGHQNHTQTGRRTNLPTVQLLQQTVGKFLGPTNHTHREFPLRLAPNHTFNTCRAAFLHGREPQQALVPETATCPPPLVTLYTSTLPSTSRTRESRHLSNLKRPRWLPSERYASGLRMHIDTTDLDTHHSLDADTPSLVIT